MDLPLTERPHRGIQRQDIVAMVVVLLTLAVLLVANRHVFLPSTLRPSLAQSAGVPTQFPPDFPIHPGAVYLGTTEAQGQVSGRMYDRAWFATRATGEDVVGWYYKQLGHDYSVTSVGDYPSHTDRFNIKSLGNRRVIQVEVFAELERPTTFSVDYFPAPE